MKAAVSSGPSERSRGRPPRAATSETRLAARNATASAGTPNRVTRPSSTNGQASARPANARPTASAPSPGRAGLAKGLGGEERGERQRLLGVERRVGAQEVERAAAHVVEDLLGLLEHLAARTRLADALQEVQVVEAGREVPAVGAGELAAPPQRLGDALEQRVEVAERGEDQRRHAQLAAQPARVEVLVAHVRRHPQVVVAADVEVPLQLAELEAAEGLVLVPVQEQGRLLPERHEAIVELAARGELGLALAREVALDQLREEIVLVRDEVRARAVQRIGGRRGLARQPPAVGREVALGRVGDLRVAPLVE